MWLRYKTAIEKANAKAKQIWEYIQQKENKSDFAPTMCLAIALKAQAIVLEKVNSEALQSTVCWDENLDFPSLPILAADSGFLEKALAKSFSHWVEIWEETLEKCYCGSFFRKGHGRSVKIKIVINHCLESNKRSILVKQFIGIKTDDLQHARHHYNLAKESRVDKDVIIVWECENRITPEFELGPLRIFCEKKERAECIHEPTLLEYIENFWNQLQQTKGEEYGKYTSAT